MQGTNDMISVTNLTVHAGKFRLDDISFDVPTGKHAVLMGKTGCGKTTILEAICGLKHVSSGRIELMDREVTKLRVGERGIGFVPQDGALFSTMTVRDNLAFGPRIRGWVGTAVKERVEELANDLGITHLLKRKPLGLSGGERQRVALGRALATRPQILCLDEPLSALDEETHEEIAALIKRLVADYNITALHITHSQQEAKLMGTHHLYLEEGRLMER